MQSVAVGRDQGTYYFSPEKYLVELINPVHIRITSIADDQSKVTTIYNAIEWEEATKQDVEDSQELLNKSRIKLKAIKDAMDKAEENRLKEEAKENQKAELEAKKVAAKEEKEPAPQEVKAAPQEEKPKPAKKKVQVKAEDQAPKKESAPISFDDI